MKRKTKVEKERRRKITTLRVEIDGALKYENGEIVSIKFVFFIWIRWIEKCHITNLNPATVNFMELYIFVFVGTVCVYCVLCMSVYSILCNTPPINNLKHGISIVQFLPFFFHEPIQQY